MLVDLGVLLEQGHDLAAAVELDQELDLAFVALGAGRLAGEVVVEVAQGLGVLALGLEHLGQVERQAGRPGRARAPGRS